MFPHATLFTTRSEGWTTTIFSRQTSSTKDATRFHMCERKGMIKSKPPRCPNVVMLENT